MTTQLELQAFGVSIKLTRTTDPPPSNRPALRVVETSGEARDDRPGLAKCAPVVQIRDRRTA